MSYRSFLLGSLCAVAVGTLSLGAAQAASLSDFHGTVSGNYANLKTSHGGGSADLYGINGAGTMALGIGSAHFQGDLGYHRLSTHGADADLYNVGGTLYWTPGNVRFGGTLHYNDAESHGSAHVTNYGLFAQYFAYDELTLSAKTGLFNATHGYKGYYVGAQATGYATPDIALNAAIDYTHVNRLVAETSYSLTGEWLVSESMPVSIYAGYSYSDLTHTSAHVDTWMAGVRYYLDGTGADNLRNRQRTGTLDWTTGFDASVLN